LIFGSESAPARCGVRLPSPLDAQALWMSGHARATLDEDAAILLRLQSRLIGHYFRLQGVERVLSRLARPDRAAAAGAVRQVELERERLGRELHTGVGQLLAAIGLHLEVIATGLPDPPAAVQNALDRIAALAGDAGEEVRSISRRLHPPEWQRLNLESALRQLWENSGVPQRFEGSLRIAPLGREPEQEVRVLLYRAMQEGLSNLVRHAQATRVTVGLTAGAGGLALRIEDNGVGFDADGLLNGTPNVSRGIGLRSLREQGASLGGKLEVVSCAGGTRLELTLPFELS
jgi:two-component system NarL family sensor kinase